MGRRLPSHASIHLQIKVKKKRSTRECHINRDFTTSRFIGDGSSGLLKLIARRDGRTHSRSSLTHTRSASYVFSFPSSPTRARCWDGKCVSHLVSVNGFHQPLPRFFPCFETRRIGWVLIYRRLIISPLASRVKSASPRQSALFFAASCRLSIPQ